jgi:hypothetical protein
LVTACLALTLLTPATAEERGARLQGLFCNTEAQIDAALAHIGQGRTPRAAGGLVNSGGAVCTYVDRLHYVVDRPMEIGENRSIAPLVKYRGMLVGVTVGDRLRPVIPPVEIFFITPERLADVAIERRT